MVYTIGVQNLNNQNYKAVSFKADKKEEKGKCENQDLLLYDESKKHPITTGLKIQSDKLKKAVTTYPVKGFSGSKNANFYEFLTMGMVPYLTGSAAMIGVFNLASKFFDTEAAKSASKLGKRMGIGVVLYGIGKTLSKKLIEKPVKYKYGIDVNLPYKKKIDELPEKRNKGNLTAYEYHKAYESVDFPRWDLFYDNYSKFGEKRNSYFIKVGKKLGIHNDDLDHADQKVKPIIKEKVIKTRLFSTLSSYLWAATGVGIAMQENFGVDGKDNWADLELNPVKRINNFINHRKLLKAAAENNTPVKKYTTFIQDFGSKFKDSFKKFINGKNPKTKIAGRILLGAAIGMTLLGNFSTLFDFNKYRGKKPHAASSLIDENREKVVC